MNIVIIDDEQASLEIMKGYCEQLTYVGNIYCFEKPLEALAFIKEQQVDLVISDINMPLLAGTELITLAPHSTDVIFMSAHSSFAVDAFELNALDYLLKPVSFARFVKAMEKKGKQQATIDEGRDAFIFVKIDGVKKRINIEDIQYVQANGDYVNIVTVNQKTPFLALMSMNKVQSLLPSKQFIRVHRSSIVNLACVDVIDTDHLYIGDKDITIGKTYRKLVEEKVNVDFQ